MTIRDPPAVFAQLLADDDGKPAVATRRMTPDLTSGAELGLGAGDPETMSLVEVDLG